MARPSLNSEYYPSSGKHDAGFVRISVDELNSQTAATELIIEPHTYNEGQYKLSVSIDPERVSYSEAHLVERLTGLIEHSGIEGLELEPSRHGNSYSVKLATEDPTDLTRITQTLSRSVDLDRGRTIYAVIDPEVSNAVADELAAVIDGKDIEGGEPEYLTAINRFETQKITAGDEYTPEGVREYIVVRSDITDTNIESIGSNSHHVADKQGEGAFLGVTDIEFAPNAKSAVQKALGSIDERASFSAGHATIEAPISQVSKALLEAGLLTPAIDSEIQMQSTELKGSFITACQTASRDDLASLDADRALERIMASKPGVTA